MRLGAVEVKMIKASEVGLLSAGRCSVAGIGAGGDPGSVLIGVHFSTTCGNRFTVLQPESTQPADVVRLRAAS